MKTSSRGFSLIELMIVIAIVGILAAVAVPSYQNYIRKAKTANLLATIQGGQLAIEDYVLNTGDTGCYNIPQPTSVPAGLQNFWLGYQGTCYSMAVGDFPDYGHLFQLWYAASFSSDGAISWQCYYWKWPVGEDVSYAPNGCINDQVNR